ncbi:hypothetical protein Vi05172_g1937 [Venturia inaequalis]|nr:hypothetical protein Vi05172_g1937 [Venturia inaequalis]
MVSTSLEPQPATFYNLEDHSERNWLPAYALTIQIVVTFLVWARLFVRFTTNGRPGFDDVLIFLAWILGTLMTAVCILSVYRYGFNKHIWGVPMEEWWKGGLIAYIIESLFLWSTCLTKVSVLMFARRLVRGTCSRNFKWAIWAAIAFVLAHTIAFYVLTFVACRPFVALWQQYNPDWLAKNPVFFCTDAVLTTQLSKLAGALSVVTDFYSVMLPAVLIFKIRITKRQKYGLLFIFGLGYLVVAAGIARTIYLDRAQAEVYDKSWLTFNIFVASIAECNVGIACACAPSMKTLFGRFFRDVSVKYGSGGNSQIRSKADSIKNNNGQGGIHIHFSVDFSESSDVVDGIQAPMETVTAKTDRLKAVIGANEKGTLEAYTKEDADCFAETHEHRNASVNPVASGLGDGLV